MPVTEAPTSFGIETSHYGLTLDIADFRNAGLGRLDTPASYEQALEHKADRLRQLPPAELLIEIEAGRVRYRATTCQAGLAKGVKHLSHVRLWESGRYVQHYDFLGLDFRSAEGEPLACDATLDLVAWPGSLTLNLNVSPRAPLPGAELRLAMTSEMGNWERERRIEGSWKTGEPKSVSLHCAVVGADNIPPADISVTVGDDQQFPVRFDAEKNCYMSSVHQFRRSWRTGYTDIRNYDEFKITVKGSGSGSGLAIPFLLDLRTPANITGVCPVLCDESGRPTGIPVQLSKNWHYKPMGSYLMAYTMLPTDQDATYLLRIVYGFYGTLPSASHAQLSLIGYGGHGRWDQLAIGCWGETICFDMDMSLVDVAITDIRALMLRTGTDGKKWTWTNAGWGGDWLSIQDVQQEKFFWTDLKTAYLSHGPCLTQVKHRGCYGADREVEFLAHIQTLRTDDYCRTFQRLSYTFNRDVSAKKIWLYKLGRTFHYHTPRLAYGNRDGLIAEQDVPAALEQGQAFLNEIDWSGPAPYWVAFTGARETVNNRALPNGYRALIIRQYQAVIGGALYTNPTFSAPVHQSSPTNLDIELRPPAGIREFHQGDRIDLDLELITLPRVVEDYYGPNRSFRNHLAQNPDSWKTTYREAKGNHLDLTVSGGRATHHYPIVIVVDQPEVAVTIRGGVGAVPIRFEGLDSAAEHHLYQVVGGKRTRFDQSVHGHDFWQTDYDEATASYAVTFNLPLDGSGETKWIFLSSQ